MANRPAYAIVGGGYWAGRMRSILAETHRVTCIDHARRQPEETSRDYETRMSQTLEDTGAQIVWICVLPGPHIPAMVQAALNAGLHAIIEKPWLNSRDETERLRELAGRRKLVLGVHYEYCLLEEVQAWRRDYNLGAGLDFGGCFNMSRGNQQVMNALDNLASHLVAIRNYAVPDARVSQIRCGYETADERKVWIEREGGRVASIDFLENREPIIQRFIEAFERAILGGPFPFDIDFALQVAGTVEGLKAGQKAWG